MASAPPPAAVAFLRHFLMTLAMILLGGVAGLVLHGSLWP